MQGAPFTPRDSPPKVRNSYIRVPFDGVLTPSSRHPPNIRVTNCTGETDTVGGVKSRNANDWKWIDRRWTVRPDVRWLILCAALAACTQEATAPRNVAEFSDDFSSGNANRWLPDSGTWTVVNGEYQGSGVSPSGFGPNQSVVRDLQARDVDIELDMRSVAGVDKGLILRSADPYNQIELNFRAARPNAYPADLVVQELTNGSQSFYIGEFAVLIPHDVGQTIHVRARLVGPQLTVWMNGAVVLDSSFSFAIRSGRVGIGVLAGQVAAFDNVRIHMLGT